MSTVDVQKELDKMKIALMDDPECVFYTSVFFSLNPVWTHEYPSAATDGVNVYFNPTYFAQESPGQRKCLAIHETEHVAFLHPVRLGDRDPIKANIAMDYVINAGLKDRGFELYTGALYDPQYRGMCWEEVYDLLPDTSPAGFTPDVIEGARTGDDPKNTELEEHINDILVRAAMQVQAAGADPGQIPGHIRVYLDQLLHPKLPWYRLLDRHCTRLSKTDYSFRKPNRRFFPDMILPSMNTPGMGHVGAAMDMSGSVTDRESTIIVTEIYSILRRIKPKEISLVQFDTDIKSIDSVTSIADLKKVTFHGRGGTNIAPVIDWAIKARPDVLIIFTDGHFNRYNIDPKLPVIWVIYDNPSWTAPYGRVIHFQE